MSDYFTNTSAFDPLLGTPSVRPSQPTPKPRVAHENLNLPSDQDGELEAAIDDELQKEIALQEHMNLVRKASKAKFATGDIEKDVYLYKAFRRFITDMGIE